MVTKKNLHLKQLLLLSMLLVSISTYSQTLIAGWDFQTTINGGTAATVNPNAPITYVANVGSGNLYLNGTNGSSTWTSLASNPEVTSFAGTALNAGTGMSTTTTSPACLAVANTTANSKSIVFKVNMSSYNSLMISYATQKTTTGFSTQTWDYSTNGTTWTNFSTQSTIPTAFATITLPAISTALSGQANAYLRLTVTGCSTVTGNNRIDNVQFNASVTTSSSSNIISNSSFTTPSNIAYINYQTSSGLTSSNSIEVAQFNIQDGGGTADADALSTILKSISFNITNPSSLRALALFDGTTNVGEITTVGATASFSGLTLTATDNASKTFSVRTTFKSVVTDNQQFSLTVNSTTTDAAGSSFAASNAGGALTSTTGDNNRIEVTATDLIINQNPSNTLVNTLMSPSPSVYAWDILANTDLDYTGSVSLNTTGTFDAGATTTVNAVNGLATFTNLIFSSAGTGLTISATATGLNTSGNSTTFNITSNPIPVITSALTATETYGTSITTYSITASSSPTSYNATGLPSGLNINTSTGAITGTPTVIGTYTVSISATNVGGTGSANLIFTINPKVLTITGAIATTKIYDGNTTAIITGSTLVGIVGTDAVIINNTGTFDTKNVGTGKVVTSTQILSGADASKYTLTIPTGLTADITAKELTIATPVVQDKTYDGTTTATIIGTLSGVVSPDVVTLTLSGVFASSSVGSGIAVTSTSTIGGANASNYYLTQPTGLTANINAVAPVLLQWNTFGNTGTETTEPSVFNDVNIGSSNLTQGTITPSGNANRFGGSAWFDTGNTNPSTLTNAIAGNDYIQFIVTPNTGYSFTATDFVFVWDRSSTGPINVTLRSSLDGYTSDIGTITGIATVSGTAFVTNTISISGLTNISTATTFRLYGYGATAITGTGGFDIGTNVVNVQLKGSTAPASGPTSSILSGTASICNGTSTNLSVAITGGTTPFTIVYSDGAINHSVNSYVSGDPISVSPTSTTTYALVSVTDAGSNIGMGNNGSAIITVNAPTLPTTVGTYTSSTVNQLDGTSIDYSASCNQLAKITDTIGNNVLGNTTVSSTLSTTVSAPNADGYIYGRRNYTVAAASNGSALVRLYFTQADFDNYNANATGFLQLPTSGNNADPNMQYFRIATVIGGAYTISGSLGTSLNWNSTTSQWEVDVPVAMVNAQYNIVTMPSCSAVTVSGLAAANATGTTVDLSWTNVTSPAWGWYSLQYRIVGSPTWIYAGTTNNGVVTKQLVGLTAGSNYEVQVRRHCSSQSAGPWSSSVTFTTLSTGCGLPMTFNTPTGSATSVTVTWTAVSGAAWYEFRYGVSSSNVWTNGGTLGGSATTNTFTGLASGTSYDVQGRTFCPDGSASAWSASATYNTVATGCALPMTFNTPTGSATSVTVTWTAVSGASWYEFRYGVSGSNVWTNAGTLGGSATTKTISGLSSGTSYDVQGRTFCPDGSASAWSASATYNTVASGCSLPPVFTTDSVVNTTAYLSWTAVTGAGWYQFQYKESSASTWTSWGTLGASATTIVVSGLTASTSYDFQGLTYCGNGVPSAWSASTTFTTGVAAKMSTSTAIAKNTENAINIYPNPTKGIVNVDVTLTEASILTLKVMDMSGRVVKQIQTNSTEGMNHINVNLENLSPGMYTLQLYANEVLSNVTRIRKD